jgi:hypothetical protein
VSRLWAGPFVGTVLVAVAACSPVETAVVAKPGIEFALTPGTTATVSGEDTQITFRGVVSDSRCPVDVTCVWAGDASIELTIVQRGSPVQTRVLSLNRGGVQPSADTAVTEPVSSEFHIGDLTIRFVGLDPVPRQSDRDRAYVAHLIATRD